MCTFISEVKKNEAGEVYEGRRHIQYCSKSNCTPNIYLFMMFRI